MTLLLRNNRLSVPSKKETNGSTGLSDISWGNAIIVSAQGSTNGEREKLNIHFDKLEDAVSSAQSGDIIMVFGNIQIDSRIQVIDGREITILVMGGTLTSQTSLAGVLFTASNNSVLKIHGAGTARINFQHNGGLASANNSGYFKLSSFLSIKSIAGISLNGGKGLIIDVQEMEFTGTGGGTCTFYIQNAELIIQRVSTMTTTAAHFFCGNNASVIRLESISDMACTTGDFYLSSIGTGNELEIFHSKISQAHAGDPRGIIEFLNEGKLRIKNSEIVASSGKVVKLIGELNIWQSILTTESPTQVVDYTQSNALQNEIAQTKLLGNPFFSGMNFVGNVNSRKLLMDGIRTNVPLSTDSQIISGYIIFNPELY